MPLTDRLGTDNSTLGNIVFASSAAGTSFSKSASSTLALSQAVARSMTYNVSAASTLTLTDRARLSHAVAANNVLTLTDDAQYQHFPNTSVDNVLTLTQLAECVVHHYRSVESILSLVDEAVGTKIITVEAENTLTLVDSAVRVIEVEAESDLVLTGVAVGVKVRNVAAVQSLVFTQTGTREMTFNRIVHQGLPINHSATKTMAWARSASNALSLVHAAVGISSKHAHNELALTGEAEYQLIRKALNTLILTQTVDRNVTYNRHTFSNLIPFQILARQMTYRRSVSQELNLLHTASAQVVRFASSHLNLEQLAEAVVTKPASNVLEFTQGASVNITAKRSLTSTLFLSHTAEVQKSKAVTAQSIVAFNQFARGTRVLTVSAENVLNLTQELVADYFDESVSQTLVLAQTASAQKVATRSASNTLALSQTVSVSKTIVRAVSNVLVFQSSTQKKTGIVSFPTVDVPNAQVTVIRRKCVMILEAVGGAITLPCPEFNDKEGSLIRLNVKRTMDGTRRVYKRDNPTSKLNYDLVMDRLKAIELRQFLLAHNSEPLRLTNFKGELWFVLLINSPFAFVEDAFRDSSYGNRSTISLEFEGVRLN